MSDCFDHFGDACDDYWFGETFDNGYSREYSVRKHCDYCGEKGLHWKYVKGKWHLHKDGTNQPHFCLKDRK